MRRHSQWGFPHKRGQRHVQNQTPTTRGHDTATRHAHRHAQRYGRHAWNRRERLAVSDRHLHRRLRLRRGQGHARHRLHQRVHDQPGQLRATTRQEPRLLPLRRRRQRDRRSRLLRQHRAPLHRPSGPRARLGGLPERRMGQLQLGARLRQPRPREDRRMSARLHVRRLPVPDPGRRAQPLRPMGRAVRQQQRDRVPDETVELWALRRGHAPVHQQRPHPWIRRPIGSELLPRYHRTVEQERQPRQHHRHAHAGTDAAASARTGLWPVTA
ncbi:hypothetical protein SCIP_0691 [Scardovia inopinata JCM 12537]|nr:hypothetical protein SCIP_0691 [Scardovia inopinata JCM 12537]